MKYLFFVFLSFSFSSFGQYAQLFGKITSEQGEPLEAVIIRSTNGLYQTSSSAEGIYELTIPANQSILLETRYVGYLPRLIDVELKENDKKRLNIILKFDNAIEQIVIADDNNRTVAGATTIDGNKTLAQLPAISGGVETLIKTLPGVQAGNELSSQYNVRGGSFDENSIYLNGLELIRPQLIRSGQQEGLSFLNPSLTDDIYFSAGGFESQYGDKLSSILSITYEQPEQQRGQAYLGFMGAGVSLENISKNQKHYYSAGGRFESRKYLLNSLDEKGEYNPISYDLQAMYGINVSTKTNIELIGIANQTRYDFEPELLESNFGTINNLLTFSADLDGQEESDFGSLFGGATLRQTINNQLALQFSASYQANDENELIDMYSDYLLGEFNTTTGATDTLSMGNQINRVDNALTSSFLSLTHQGILESNNNKHYLVWTAGYQRQQFDDRVFEQDSLLIIDNDTGAVTEEIRRNIQSSHAFTNHITSASIQDTYIPGYGNFTLTGGMRVSHASQTRETLISPRLQASLRPNWNKDVVFRAATGFYQQHPLYREFRAIDGEINPDVKAQKSIHAILGADYKFLLNDRPFNFTTELYYKDYWDVNAYEYDEIRIRYLANNSATAYAAGVDFRFSGEFVEDALSWVSLSLLKTEETINGETIRRPTDQRYNLSVYLQDYMPNNENFKLNLVGTFGGKLPIGLADGNRLNDTFNISSYERIDAGISANLTGNKDARLPYSPFKAFKSVWFSAEIFNLFDNTNVSSYQWISTPQGGLYPVPNQLTSRRLNAKLTVEF